MSQIAIFNETNNLLDLTETAASGPAAPGAPVVTNGDGLVDATLLGLPSSILPQQKTVAGNYSINDTDGTIFVNATGGPVTVTLPDATTVSGYKFIVKKIDNSANAVTIVTQAGQTIDEGSQLSIAIQNQYATFQSDSLNWQILSTSSSANSSQVLQSVNYAASLTLDFSSGWTKKVNLTGPLTLEFSGAPSGPDLVLILVQDSTGGHAVTFASDIGGIAPNSLETTPNTLSILKFILVGSTYQLSNSPTSGLPI